MRNARKCRGVFGSAWAADLSNILAAAFVIFLVSGLSFFGPCIAWASEASPSTRAPSSNGILWTGLLVLLICALGLWTFSLLRQARARRRASAALRESKEHLELALSAAGMGTWSWTVATNIIFRDAVLNRILGLDPVESNGPVEDSRKMVHPDDRSAAQAEFERAIRDRTAYRAKYRILRPDGSIRWLLTQGRPFYDGAGGFKYFTGVVLDVTEREAAMEALTRSEERQRAIIEAAPYGAYEFELQPDGRLLFTGFNRAADRILGIDHARFLGRTIEEAFPSLVTTPIPAAFKTVASTGKRYDDDGVEFADDRIAGVFDLSAFQTGPNRMALFFRDVTDRKRAEESLRNSERRLQEMVSFLPDATIVVDGEGKVIAWNKAMEEMTGIEAGAILGKGDREYALPFYGERRPILIDVALGRSSPEKLPYHGFTRTGDTLTAEVRTTVLRREGLHLWCKARPFYDSRGRIVGAIESVRDITEMKRAEEEMLRAYELTKTIFDTVDGLIVMLDREGRIRRFNAACERLTGWREEEVIGRCLWEFLIPDEQRPGVQATFQSLTAGMFPNRHENDWICRDGSRRWIAWVNSVILDPSGRIENVLGTGIDMTEHKRAEEDLEKALAEVRRLKEGIEAENLYLREELRMTHLQGEIIGQSAGIKQMLALAEQVAPSDSTVLIQGETGTGKELLARAIHNMSARRDRPLVVVNCSTLPSTLVESELFGREKGAYTGAITRQMGRFEVADHSTIFLDEIGELPIETQAKLLRVLQEGQFERLGSTKTIEVDIRIIAATNRDLSQEVKEGKFREDLFYRLNVFPIDIPPLRERQEDIPTLVWAFVNEFGEKMGKRIESIPRPSMEALQKYLWPGNIRELRNVIERAMIAVKGKVLQIPLPAEGPLPGKKSLNLRDLEREHVAEVLDSVGWRIRGEGGAAKLLGLKPTTLESRMRRLGIQRKN